MSESPTGSDAAAAGDTPDEQTEGAAEAETFANRAERRAKGKKSAKTGIFSKGQAPVGRGAVQSPRQYGNRRSG